MVSVGEFLEYVGQLRDVGAREGEARALTEGAVQIMSIHAAKGLEFPVVVIGDVTHRRSARDGVIIDPDLGPLVPARDDDRRLPLLYRLARAKRTDREAAESARLCYVAATRAQELLLVNGCLQMGKTLTLGKNLGEWLAPLVEGDVTELGHLPWECDAEGCAAHRQAIHIGEAPASCVLYEPRWQPDHALTAAKAAPPTGALPDRAMLDPIALSCTRATPSDREGERDSTRRVWRVVPGHDDRWAPSWVVGKLVHEALAQWRFDGEGYADWATARARHHGLTDPARLANAVTRSRSLVARLAGHPLHEELAAARPRWHEVPYTLRVDGGIDVGAIDVLYRYDGVWTIVDIKTDRIRTAGEVAAYITKHCYVAQLARYRRAVEELLGETPCAFLCLLDVAGAVHLEPLA